MKKFLKRASTDESGMAAVELALILGILVVGIILALNTLRNTVNSKLSTVASNITTAGTGN